MTYPSKEEVEMRNSWDLIYVITVVVIVIALGYSNKREIDTKISGLAGCIMRGDDWQKKADKRLDRLEQRVYFPLFTAHCKTCQQCGNPQATPDGPESLCEEGFKLWQQDMRNNQ